MTAPKCPTCGHAAPKPRATITRLNAGQCDMSSVANHRARCWRWDHVHARKRAATKAREGYAAARLRGAIVPNARLAVA